MNTTQEEQLRQEFFDKWFDTFQEEDLPLLYEMAKYYAQAHSQWIQETRKAIEEMRQEDPEQIQRKALMTFDRFKRNTPSKNLTKQTTKAYWGTHGYNKALNKVLSLPQLQEEK